MDAPTVAAYVASSVALAVGIVAPWLSNRSAADRQRELLDHERAMRRRDEIITVIGTAASASSTRFYLIDRFHDMWLNEGRWDDPHVQEIERERVNALERERDAWGRVEIHFAADSPVRARYEKWRDALDDYGRLVRFGFEAGRTYESALQEVVEKRDLATGAADLWLAAARDTIAALDRGEPPGGD